MSDISIAELLLEYKDRLGMVNEITKLKKALEIANKAIEFYADKANWQTPESQGFYVDDISKDVSDMIETDDSESGSGGDKAREAQKQIKEIMEGK